jgi:hypothetical protein
VLWSYPAAEATGVPPQTSIRVQFDRFLAPDSAIRQAICIQAEDPTNRNAPCAGGLAPEYDPVDRVAVWKGAALLPNQRYNVRLLVPANDDDPTGVRAFDGVPLEKEFKFAFTTGAGPNPMFVEPDRVTNSGFCASTYCAPTPCKKPTPTALRGPRDYLANDCALACHHPNPKDPRRPSPQVFPLTPDGGLADDVLSVVRQLVMQATVATESATGPDPSVARRSPKDVFGENMPYIDARSPGNSFLLYKVLLGMPPRCGHLTEESANPQFADVACSAVSFAVDEYPCKSISCGADGGAVISGADAGAVGQMGTVAPPIVPSWIPEDQWKPPVIGEYNRLRLRIRGDAMPVGTAVPYQNVVALSAWIAAGASTTCP